MLESLRKSDRIAPVNQCFLELATLSKSPHPEDTGHHGRISRHAKTLAAEIVFDRSGRVLQKFAGTAEFACDEVRGTQVVVRRNCERNIAEALSDGINPLCECTSVRSVAVHACVLAHVSPYASEPVLIVEGAGKGFTFAQAIEASFELPQGEK